MSVKSYEEIEAAVDWLTKDHKHIGHSDAVKPDGLPDDIYNPSSAARVLLWALGDSEWEASK